MTYGLYNTEKERWVTVEGVVLEFQAFTAAQAQRRHLPEEEQMDVTIRPFKPKEAND